MSKILNSFLVVAPYINDLTFNDIGITITDREKYLLFVAGGNIPQLVETGQMVPEGTVVKECINTGQKIIKKVSKELFGFPYIACGIPIIEDNEIVGSVSFVISIDQQEKLQDLAQELSATFEHLTKSSQSIDNDAAQLSDISKNLSNTSKKSVAQINETDNILKMIENISNKTNLLGLNASIEAARAGKEGLGFSVVAEEIRKLSIDSSESVQQIEKILKDIKSNSSQQEKTIKNITEIIKSQSDAMNNINSSLQELYSSINILVEEAENLTK